MITMIKNFEAVPNTHFPIDRLSKEDSPLYVSSIISLHGTDKEKAAALNENVQSGPFVNQISNESELKVCYAHGFRPYGQNLSWENTRNLLKEQGSSICMTINIDTKPSSEIKLGDDVSDYHKNLINKLNKYHEKQMSRR
ncbi:TPA: hypothetical protein QC181_005641 [Bacillus cereus]|nr:hypothetical protein [Bacillus cereus]